MSRVPYLDLKPRDQVAIVGSRSGRRAGQGTFDHWVQGIDGPEGVIVDVVFSVGSQDPGPWQLMPDQFRPLDVIERLALLGATL